MTATAKQAERERQVRVYAESKGLRILPFGRAWRVVGYGVDVLVAKLAYLTEDALRPMIDRRE